MRESHATERDQPSNREFEDRARAGRNRSWRAVYGQRILLQSRAITLATLSLAAIGFLTGYRLESLIATVRIVFAPAIMPATGAPQTGTPSADVAEIHLRNLSSELSSQRFLEEVYQSSKLAFAPDYLRARVQFKISDRSKLVTVEARAEQAETAVQMAVVYAQQAEECIRDAWRGWVGKQRERLADQLKLLEGRIQELDKQTRTLLATRPEAVSEQDWQSLSRQLHETELKKQALETQLSANQARLGIIAREFNSQSSPAAAIRKDLQDALKVYTEEHPKVKALREAIQKLETQTAPDSTGFGLDVNAATNQWLQRLHGESVELRSQIAAQDKELQGICLLADKLKGNLGVSGDTGAKITGIETSLQILKQQRQRLIQQIEETRFQEESAASLNHIVELPRVETVSARAKWIGGFKFGGLGALFGLATAVILILSRHARFHPIRSAGHLEAVTGLPVLAMLGDTKTMESLNLQIWAIKTFSCLAHAVAPTNDRALVFGFASSYPGEGKTTWINLLATAARQEGYQVVLLPNFGAAEVMTDTTQSSAMPNLEEIPVDEAIDAVLGHERSGNAPETPVMPGRAENASTPAASESEPLEQTESLDTGIEKNASDASGTPSARAICLAQSTKKWQITSVFQNTLARWRGKEKAVVFVELPPCSTPESLLLAERIPNLVWISDNVVANEEETRMQITTLKECRCNLIGAVLNRTKAVADGTVARILSMVVFLFLPVCPLWSAEPSPQQIAVPPPPVLSATTINKLAGWQERLTLGSGDVLDISIYEQKESQRTGVAIGPDGRINYLQARDIMAAGLTIDELRDLLEKTLAKYHIAPRVVINPQAYKSKKFYLLGNVVQKGVVPLERPLSIVEAIAMGRGFVSTPESQNVELMVDLSRSFLVRRRGESAFERMPVNFEALFQQGDLSQNIPLEPEDYLFFPAAGIQEIFVVGDVKGPGAAPFTKDMTAISAIAARGGYTDKAWKSKILVIRGSLTNPQTFVINTSDVLKGKAKDFMLNNRDIVFVSRKPWAYAQELLEEAINQFAYAAVVGYTGQHVGPWIKEPIIK